MSGSDVRSKLEAQRKHTLEKMVDEPERSERLTLLQLAMALEVAIASLPSDQSQSEYGRFKRVRDAIKEYLSNVDLPVRVDTLVEALIDGGMRRKPDGRTSVTTQEVIENTRTIVRKSISFHLINRRGIDAHVIKEVNGKVGLWEWPDERFK